MTNTRTVYSMFILKAAALLLLPFFLNVSSQPTSSSAADTFLPEAIELMQESPLIDTHVDLPQIIRSLR